MIPFRVVGQYYITMGAWADASAQSRSGREKKWVLLKKKDTDAHGQELMARIPRIKSVESVAAGPS
jgi:hypothetical protein